jgi:hypothetical protein
MARRRQGSLLPVIVVAVMLLFATGIYLVVAAPTVTQTSDSLDAAGGEAIDNQGLRGQFNFVKDVALVYVPLILLFGAGAWVYSAVAGTESGGGLR